jgi:hypothetical protein
MTCRHESKWNPASWGCDCQEDTRCDGVHLSGERCVLDAGHNGKHLSDWQPLDDGQIGLACVEWDYQEVAS